MLSAKSEFDNIDKIIKNFLYFKGALWIAATTNLLNDSFPNVFLNKTRGSSKELDFIGVDIDEGFRMAEYSAQSKIVLDPKITFLLHKHIEKWRNLTNSRIHENVKIMDYVKLKGIWGEREFPIIWYTDKWQDEDSLFLYDEQFTSTISKSYLSNPNKDRKMDRILKIFNDLEFPHESINVIEGILENKSNNSSAIKNEKIQKTHRMYAVKDG